MAGFLLVPGDPIQKHWARGFWSLFAVQFQGAFSDNVFKFLVIFLISKTVTEQARDQYISVVLGLFALAFILFSMAGGFLADRYSKRYVVGGTKAMEVVIMLLGTLALFLQNIPFLIVILFLMSVQSAFFGPSKYGLLPELLPETKLSWGNGMLGMGTFLSIITGGILAGVLSEWLGNDHAWKAGAGLVGLAAAGFALSLAIPKVKAADPAKVFRLNFMAELFANLRYVGKDRILALAVVGSVYFWFIAALFGEPTLLVYGQDLLNLSDTEISYLRAFLAVGIAVGSVLAGILSGKKIEYGLIPLGAFGMAACAALLAIPGLSFIEVGVLLGLLGVAGGFFDIPINALLQHRPDPRNKGSVLAANGWLTSVGMLGASGVFWLTKSVLGLEPTTIFLVGAILTLAGTIYAVCLVPDSLMRLLIWLLTHTIYRVTVLGRQHLPERSGALLVSNHLSMADACFLIASTDRRIRFLLHRDHYRKWWVRPFARMMKAIPIASDQGPREMLRALRQAADLVNEGRLVCIFAEGQISRIGQTLPFQRGVERILKNVRDAPVIPVFQDNAWGSIFSFERGKFTWKIPHRIPYPITISYGEPLPPTAEVHEIRSAVVDLGADAWELRKKRMFTLSRSLINTARRHRFRFAMTDSGGGKSINFIAALTKALFLRGRLAPIWGDAKNVGILLPPSNGGALVNWAALLMGKVPVNLNYTLSPEAIQSCIDQCGLTSIVTSEKVLARLKFEAQIPVHRLEDLAKDPRTGEKLKAAALAWLCPRFLLERIAAAGKPARIDDLATVIFSSGSTGEPKGVMLSHYNIVSNVQQMNQVLRLRSDDRFLGVLPFFHSFGFTTTLAVPAVLGIGSAYHFNPMEAKVIGPLVKEHRVSILLATPTFLQFYLRGCEADQLASLRIVAIAAEKLPQRLADAFREKFGVHPLEGYGCTECAPCVTLNTEDFAGEVDGAPLRQSGAKAGSVGRPVPGMTVKIVDPDTRELRPVGESGLLLVKGPNVMGGYLGAPEKTGDVLRDGWYDTGDIVCQDEEGFITITDRLSRFSKIGGEMVPHIKVEEKLHEAAGVTGQTFAVTSVPDDKKGERLIVFHTQSDEEVATTREKLAAVDDIPNLWKPKPDQFIRVEELPYLGSGKLDLKRLKAMAAEKV